MQISALGILRQLYSGRTWLRSTPYVLMRCLIAKPGHQLIWYWLCRINVSLPSTGNDFSYLAVSVIQNDEWWASLSLIILSWLLLLSLLLFLSKLPFLSLLFLSSVALLLLSSLFSCVAEWRYFVISSSSSISSTISSSSSSSSSTIVIIFIIIIIIIIILSCIADWCAYMNPASSTISRPSIFRI